jgi:hypothetical protein
VDLTLTRLRQLSDVTAGLYYVGSRCGLCRIASTLVEVIEYRSQLRECIKGSTGSLGELNVVDHIPYDSD